MNLFSGVVLLGALLACAVVGIWWKKCNVLELLVLGVTYWFCAWVVAGMGLFVLDEFRLFRCACATVGLIALTGIAAVLVRRKRDKTPWKQLTAVSFDIRPFGIPILVCAAGAILVAVKHGFFGMGQDEGVYQTVAINLMNGLTDRQQDFAEYHLVSEEQQSVFTESVLHRLVGYDIEPAVYPDTVYDDSVSPVSGIYHGIPTYASILAMWGTIFGMENMMQVQTIFYFCTIFLVFFICRNLKLRRTTGLLACVVTAASPIVIWVAKSSLTEGFLGVLIALYLYFLTDKAHPERQWMSILPVAVFGCYHVSIYTMVPLFVVVYGGLYWLTRRKSFAILMPVTVVGYLISFFAMRHVQPFYTMNNYNPIFGLGIDQGDLPWFVPLVCGIALALCGGFWLVMHFVVHRKHKNRTPEAYLLGLQQSRLGVILVELLLVPLALYVLVSCVIGETAFVQALIGSTLWGYIACAGIFPLVVAWILGVVRPRFYLETPQRLVVLVVFFYTVLFYAAFLRKEVQYFYYYGRYLAPFLPVVAVFAALTLDRLRARATMPVMAAGLVVLAPYDRFLSIKQDDTRMQWDILEETAAQIQEGDCLIVDSNCMWTLYLPLRAMTGAAVYPVLEDDLVQQAEELDAQYDTVYYLSTTANWSDSFTSQFSQLYSNEIEQSYDDNVSGRVGLMPFPLAYRESSAMISLYQYQSNQLSYPAVSDAATRYQGFGDLEGEFCWSDSEETAVRCYLEAQDYELTVELGCKLSLEALGLESYEIQVEVNGMEAGTLEITPENNGQSVCLTIPAELLEDGENIVTFYSELWDADQVTPGDARQLGFPLKSLEFTPLS